MASEISISATGINQFIARWEDEEGCRYHVWISHDGIVEDRVYKNPRMWREGDDPAHRHSQGGLERSHPEYFTTRHLDGTAKTWKPIMDAIRWMAKEGAALRTAAAARQAELDKQNAERFKMRMLRYSAVITDAELGAALARYATTLTVAQLIEWEEAGVEPR